MQYLNPYSLLGIEAGSLFDNPKSIRAAKRRVLADIALEDTYENDGITIDRSAALHAIEDLDDSLKSDIHARVQEHPAFHRFLTHGDSDYFERHVSSGRSNEFSDEQSIEFLSPFYVDQFSRLLNRCINEGDNRLLRLMVHDAFRLGPAWHQKAYDPANQYYEDIDIHIRGLTDELSESGELTDILPEGVELMEFVDEFYNPFKSPPRFYPIRRFLDYLISSECIDCLNELPDDFQLIRDEIANALDGLAVDVNNVYNEARLALSITERAIDVDSGAVTYQRIVKNRDILNTIVNRENVELLNSQLIRLISLIQQKRFNCSKEVVEIVDRILDVDAINTQSTVRMQNSIIESVKHLIEIAWKIVSSYNSPDDALAVISRGLQIRLQGQIASERLLENLSTEYGKILMLGANLAARPLPWEDIVNRLTPVAGKSSKRKAERPASKVKAEVKIETDFTAGLISEPGIFESFVALFRKAEAHQKIIAGAIFLILATFALGFVLNITDFIRTAGSEVSTTDKGTRDSYGNTAGANSSLANVKSGNVPVVAASPAASLPQPTPTPKIERPNSGFVMSKGSLRRGLGNLSISNGTYNDAIAKLIDTSTGKSYREVFVRSKSTITISGIASGYYELRFSTGQDYAPSVKKFLRNAEYNKFDDVLNFQETREAGGIRFKSFEVTLNKVAYGTASTSSIDESLFDR